MVWAWATVADRRGGTRTSPRVQFEHALRRIADGTLRALPQADGVGVGCLEGGVLGARAATSEFVSTVDDVQYGVAEGPCVTAGAQGCTVLSSYLPGDGRWPVFGSQVRPLGVRSALSVPMLVSGTVVGTLNVYARRGAAFDAGSAVAGQEYALQAGRALAQANVYRRAGELVERVNAQVETGQLVSRTTGLVMAQDGVTAREATATLMSVAEIRGIGIGEAAALVWEARLRRRDNGAPADHLPG